MSHPHRLSALILHNRDFTAPDAPEFASRADVENAARHIAAALAERGHAAELYAMPAGDPAAAVADVLATLRARKPDLVFNLVESLDCDAQHEAVLPSLFELCGVRYTGSGPLALATALRKDRAKEVLRAHRVPTPQGFVVDALSDLPAMKLPPFPLIVKPTREDASTGIELASVVYNPTQLKQRVEAVLQRYRQPALVEQFIGGREVYVSLVGNGASLTALPMHEVDFSDMPAGAPHIVTYEGKWNTDSPEYHGTRPMKAELPPAARARLADAARAAFDALELRDYARVDLRLASDGKAYVIDVNPNCDLSNGAGVSRAAGFGGIAYPELIERICFAAVARYEPSPSQAKEKPHVERARAAGSATVSSTGGAGTRPSAPAPRPRGAASAVDQGRSVHARGDLGRARARRRRAR
jgi:D-alanine-D-alanine ligase